MTYFILWAYTGISVSHSQFKLCILTRWDFNFCVHSSPLRDLIQVVKNLHNKATSAVLFNSSIEDWFRITVGVQQGCLLSPTLFSIFLERITTGALKYHEGTVSFGGRTITNFHFADDIDGLAGEEEELAKVVGCLDKASTAYSMEISAEKTKLMRNKTSGINTEIKVNGQKLETVTSFKYLGSL